MDAHGASFVAAVWMATCMASRMAVDAFHDKPASQILAAYAAASLPRTFFFAYPGCRARSQLQRQQQWGSETASHFRIDGIISELEQSDRHARECSPGRTSSGACAYEGEGSGE